MAISASGALTLTTVQTEWGGSNPIGMSEYYAGGDNVFSGATDGDGNAIPSTGAIDMSDFYDTTAATPLTIGSNTNNYNIKTAVQNAGAGLDVPVLLTINSGVTVGSTSTGTPAMKTDTGWSQGVTITITNNGSIVGASGSDTSANPSSGGGNGGGSSSHPNVGGTHPAGQAGSGNSGSAGSSNNGGDAFEHSQTANDYLSVVFATAGTRTGGSAGTATFKGNGGGGGAGGSAGAPSNSGFFVGIGSGGGGGANGGSGGIAYPGHAQFSQGRFGRPGGSTTGGAGGTEYDNGPANAGKGGTGGNLQQAGASGQGGNYGRAASSGGAAGSTGTSNGQAGSATAGNTGQIS